jgi:ribose transport system permease protein
LKGIQLWFARNNGALFALVLFIAMFSVYVVKNGVGLKIGLVTAVANKGVLLALVAMAQTLPILTAGLDLSVGMIFVLTNCIASVLLSGPPWLLVTGTVGVLLSGVICGAINGALVVYGRLQPIIATLATGAAYYGLALIIRPVPGGSFDPTLAEALTNQIFGIVPTSLVILLAVVLTLWLPFQLSTTGRGCYAIGSSTSAAYMTGFAVRRSRLAAYMLGGLFAAIGGLLLTAMTLSGDASASSGGTYTLSSIAAVVIGGTSLMGGVGGAVGSIFGAFVLRAVSDLLFVFDIQPLVQPLIQGLILLGAVSLGAIRVLRAPNRLDFLGVGPMTRALAGVDRPVLIAFGFIFVLIILGTIYNRQFLSGLYLLQQLRVASFLGIIASGVMLVILLGHIDLSIPWVVTIGGIAATAVAGWWGASWTALGVPVALACGALVGLANGLGVAFLRMPSMVFTLGMNAVVQGMVVMYTGGNAPPDQATSILKWLAVRDTLHVPNAVIVWTLVGVLVIVALNRMTFGRYVYAIGNSERVTYLSGISTRTVLIAAFVTSGACSAFAGAMLAGYAGKAYQAMGDPYLLPAIAAVVLGGTSILGGRGTYLGTVAGVILITVLESILSVMQIPDSARQITYGAMIIVMMLVYGRDQRAQE